MVQKMIPALPHAPSPAVAMLAIMISDGRRRALGIPEAGQAFKRRGVSDPVVFCPA